MLDRLSESLKESLRKLLKISLVDRKLVESLSEDIKKSLLAGDVNPQLATKITDSIKKRALEEKPRPGLTHREHVINIVYEELVKLLGAEPGKFEIKEKPTKILLVGLFGSGKTTTAAKLAKLFKKQGQKVCLVQTDTWRPAAYEQLKQLAEKINVPFYGIKEEKDPVKIYQKFEPDYNRFNVVILDSAGRDALSKELIEELKKLNEVVKPQEKLLVLSADIGQAAKAQAKAFQDAIAISGVIVTKLDGTAKGGGALSACAETGAKVKFIGIGEHIDDFEDYEPKRFVSRLLGLGDLQTLLRKAEEAINKEEAEALAKKLIKAEFTFDDLMRQMEALQKMGPLSQVISMIPGIGMAKIPSELLNVQEDKMRSWRHIIQSMTKQERNNPNIIDASRIKRIAKGSGKSEAEVRELIKQYNQMKKMMKMIGDQKQMRKLQKILGSKMPNILPF
ncbi:MAG: signal recognition particle receptor subunit alpha [Candidatus Nanoarchaeia archaeon]